MSQLPNPTPYIDVVTDEEFPHGIRCAVCCAIIPTGEEFVARPVGRLWDESPILVLTCVSPDCADVSRFAPDLPSGVDPRLN